MKDDSKDKQCGKCHQYKPNTAFSATDGARKYGWCRECHNTWERENRRTPERRAEVAKAVAEHRAREAQKQKQKNKGDTES